MSDGWATLAGIVAAGGGPVPFHDGYAPNPPARTLAPFTVDGTPDDAMVVDRAAALSVPAYARGRALIAATVASFPLDELRDGTRLVPARPLLDRPDPATTRSFVLRCTVEDLVDTGRAWWMVTSRDDADKPRTVEHVDPTRITVTTDRRVLVDREPVPARDLIRFDHDRSGALATGARILSTALALERAARRYALAPAPRTVLSGRGPVQLDDVEAAGLVDAFDRTARERGTAYADNVDVHTVGWSSAELQLVEARQHTNGAIANLLNLDASWLGAAVSGSSLTYTNRVDLWRGLVDLTLRSYLDTIEQRLSADDVTERGRVVRWNLDAFLRGNSAERAAIVTQLAPLGLMSRDEQRAFLDLAPDAEVIP